MAITNNLMDALTATEMLHKELGLGLHKSTVRDISDGKDTLGIYFSLLLEQIDTGVCTAPATAGEIRFKDIAKVHRGENRINRSGYATQAGDGWKRFFDQLFEQRPELAKLGWGNALNELTGKTINVWYSRNKQGYINVHFSESAYQFALQNGETGGDSVDPTKELNDDCPF